MACGLEEPCDPHQGPPSSLAASRLSLPDSLQNQEQSLPNGSRHPGFHRKHWTPSCWLEAGSGHRTGSRRWKPRHHCEALFLNPDLAAAWPRAHLPLTHRREAPQAGPRAQAGGTPVARTEVGDGSPRVTPDFSGAPLKQPAMSTLPRMTWGHRWSSLRGGRSLLTWAVLTANTRGCPGPGTGHCGLILWDRGPGIPQRRLAEYLKIHFLLLFSGLTFEHWCHTCVAGALPLSCPCPGVLSLGMA